MPSGRHRARGPQVSLQGLVAREPLLESLGQFRVEGVDVRDRQLLVSGKPFAHVVAVHKQQRVIGFRLAAEHLFHCALSSIAIGVFVLTLRLEPARDAGDQRAVLALMQVLGQAVGQGSRRFVFNRLLLLRGECLDRAPVVQQ
ncbi:hypothetical protein KBTX_04239 [wastewater metagenome]|uniref:Uncharacterized protein n=2 Tax=unclassified sequences TaxID=12908 RepID=A0A5B8RJX4_9ZZZZ|nr:hypothetical protein KBTEX_04239 [uncultured organism]